MRLGLAAGLILLAAPAAAQKALEKTQAQLRAEAVLAAQAAARAAAVVTVASPCAGLPETGRVAQKGADERFAPRLLPNRSYSCPADVRLDLSGRLPQCVRPGAKAIEGNPRAACYAQLPLGPFAEIAPRQRPTRSCPTSRLTSIVRLEGPGAGYSDVALAVVPEGTVTVTTLNNIDPATPVDENPILQNCFAFDCRLVKLEISNRAGDKIRLELRLPKGDPVTAEVRLAPVCPL
jgi:type II secretory pathway pseudopilin PulG